MTRADRFRSHLGPASGQSNNTEARREYLAFRFPAMKDAPLIETRVCQYEKLPTATSSWTAILE